MIFFILYIIGSFLSLFSYVIFCVFEWDNIVIKIKDNLSEYQAFLLHIFLTKKLLIIASIILGVLVFISSWFSLIYTGYKAYKEYNRNGC